MSTPLSYWDNLDNSLESLFHPVKQGSFIIESVICFQLMARIFPQNWQQKQRDSYDQKEQSNPMLPCVGAVVPKQLHMYLGIQWVPGSCQESQGGELTLSPFSVPKPYNGYSQIFSGYFSRLERLHVGLYSSALPITFPPIPPSPHSPEAALLPDSFSRPSSGMSFPPHWPQYQHSLQIL